MRRGQNRGKYAWDGVPSLAGDPGKQLSFAAPTHQTLMPLIRCTSPLGCAGWRPELVRQHRRRRCSWSGGFPGGGPRRDALQRMLSVAMNLTHNNGPGCAAVLAGDGLAMAARLLDAVLGPPEEEPAFVCIADRCRDCLTWLKTDF